MINYKGTPLFGSDSSVSHTSEFFAIAGTAVFWLIFLIFSFVIKTEPKKKFNEVQIVLSSTPVVQKVEESPAPSEQAAASSASKTEKSPAVETTAPKSETVQKTVEPPASKKVEIPKSKAEPSKTKTQTSQKPAASKTVPAPKVSEPVTYALDPMEAFANQTKQQPKKEFDWSLLDDDTPSETETSNQVKTVQNTKPSFSGNAGAAETQSNSKLTSQSSLDSAKSQSASTSTTSALEGIRNSTFKGNAANGVQSESTAKTKTSGSGKVEMEMSNGRSRALIFPAKPVIDILPPATSTIDSDKTVSISFKVLESGNVTEIKITPESILSSLVREQIRSQLSTWRFDPADYSAQANFEYRIVKR